MKRLLLLLLIAFGAAAEPRPISETERAAVAMVADFLARGPAALAERLAPGAGYSIEELAVRAGPREGARWTLQTIDGEANEAAFRVMFPSGYDDGLLFRLDSAGRIVELRTLGEVGADVAGAPLPVARSPLPVATGTGTRQPATGNRQQATANRQQATANSQPSTANTRLRPIAIALLVAALLSWWRLRFVSIVCVALAGALWFIPLPGPKAGLPFIELRALAPLREALARGEEPRIPPNVSRAAREIANLWILQSGAPAELSNAKTQLAELIRARVALSNDDRNGARAAFERVLAIRPRRDDLLLEAMTSIEGFAPEFKDSRDAAIYYAKARANGSQSDLRTAWTLKPVPRAELVRDTRLSPLLTDLRTLAMVSLLGEREPVRRSASFAKTPIVLPPNARAFVCGEFLRVDIRNATLEVPGGAALAPQNARLVPATFWQRYDDEAALRDAQSLLELPPRATTPAARARVLRSANALARHNRWRELLVVTDDITPRTETVAPELLLLRLRGLLRTGRVDDARALANGDAVRKLMQRSTYPLTLISVADAMANIGQYDTATPLYHAVKSEKHETLIAARLRQLKLRRKLATNGVTIQTAHFDIRHDTSINPAIASRIGDLLEAELARLQQKLPSAQLRRITANVLSWDEFRGNITNSDHILGLYDGEILFPFAGVQQFKPEVVAIITHELTHALLAQATGDNAPRWFQEGVARRMEFVPHQPNAFHDRAAGVVLPVPLIDAVLESAPDPVTMEHGYTVANTFIRFLEAKFGENAIATLAGEFAKGRDTDDALTALTGKSLDELNRDFRQWGFANNANFTSDTPWPYREWYSPGIDPRIREGFSW